MMIRRKHHRPSKLAQRRRKIFLFKIGGAAVGVIALFVGLVYVAGLEEFNISEITVEGNSAIAERSIKEIIEDKISGKLLFLFPKSNILLYPREDTEAAVLEAYKGIKEIKISVEDLQSISVTVDERKPFALWCDKEATEEESCYFLDEDGYIFTKAPSFSGSVYFRYFSVLSEEPVGQQFMESPEFQNMTFFLSSLSDIGLTPILLNEVDDADYEMHLEEGGKILFGQDQSLSFVFDNIQSVFDSEEFEKSDLSELDYADFRFGNKVYFKFK
ncbi:MAG: cell division protein FtsQ/DivIB [Candidatus Paceibacteria bacterium]